MKRIGFYNLITIFFCYLSLAVSAQDAPTPSGNDPGGKVVGQLTDNKNKPISYATVTLLKTDSTVVNGDLSKDDGSFSISPTGFGNFILRINAIGVKTQYVADINVSTSSPEKNAGTIKLSTGENTLKQVEVVAEKPLMQMSVDKKVFNVEKNITTSGGSALDVLQNVPSVSVDVDGTVNLRGKAATILIDGKPATLLGSDITSALQSMAGTSIENIEVITNPSAKYDAQGITGIINIVTKKDNKLGVNGTATLGVGTKSKYNANINLNVRKGKWNVFLNSSYRYNHNENSTTTTKYNADSGSSYNFESDPRSFSGNFNTVGATYDWNTRNSITLTQNLNVMDHSYSDRSYYYIYYNNNASGDYSENTNRNSSASGGPFSYSTSVDYKHKFKTKDEELNVDATYSNATYERQQAYNTTVYWRVARDSVLNGYGSVNETAPSTGSNGSFTGWADYVKPMFTKNGKFGTGVKTQRSWYESKNTPIVDSPIDGKYKKSTDYSLLNDYNYTQQVNAAYINWNDQMTEKFSYQLGLRAEDALYDAANFVYSNIHYSNSFFSLFPSAFISYQLPKQQTVYLNYTRRTNRPNVWSLMPFKDVSNPLVISQGNPGLDPEFINNIEFNYNKQTKRGDNIIVSVYYQNTQNLIERITNTIDSGFIDYVKRTIDSSTGNDLRSFVGKQYTRPLNLKSGTTVGMEITGHIVILPFWDATINANFFQSYITVGDMDTNARLYVSDRDGFSWRGKINSNIKLPANFSIQINAQYESEKIIAQGKMEATNWIDIGIKKSMYDNRLNIVFNLSDVFNTHKYASVYDIPGQYSERYYRNRETQVGNLSITYRFGKTPQDKLTTDMQNNSKRKTKTNNNNNQPTQKEHENNLKENDDSSDQGGGNNQQNNQGGNKEPNKGGGTRM